MSEEIVLKQNIEGLIPKFEELNINLIKPHPRNYRSHGQDQIDHIIASIKENGFYKNIVIANDDIILAGHGAVEAAKQMGFVTIPVVRLNINSSDKRALKILTGDNEISKLGVVDDRSLSEILKEIITTQDSTNTFPEELLGTGFDSKQLANLIYVTRNSDEIKDFSAAVEWVGLPSYDIEDETKKKELVLEISFDNEVDRDNFIEEKQIKISKKMQRKWSTFWPFRERNDMKSVKFEKSEE